MHKRMISVTVSGGIDLYNLNKRKFCFIDGIAR